MRILLFIGVVLIGLIIVTRNLKNCSDQPQTAEEYMKEHGVKSPSSPNPNPNVSDNIELSNKPLMEDYQVCYNARQLVLNYVKNPLEAEINVDCTNLTWDNKNEWWIVGGTGNTKTDMGVRKRFKWLMRITYTKDDDMWHSKECGVVPLD
jgi:hypothetical protein